MMKRLLMGLMLLMTATAASAEWILVGDNDEFIQYVDRTTIRRNGNLVKIWGLRDFKTVQKAADGQSYLSSKTQEEYDCKEEKVRMLAFTVYDGKMGNGKVVESVYDATRWIPIAPESIGEAKWKKACGKK